MSDEKITVDTNKGGHYPLVLMDGKEVPNSVAFKQVGDNDVDIIVNNQPMSREEFFERLVRHPAQTDEGLSFNPDWDQLKASQEALVEQMRVCNRLGGALEKVLRCPHIKQAHGCAKTALRGCGKAQPEVGALSDEIRKRDEIVEALAQEFMPDAMCFECGEHFGEVHDPECAIGELLAALSPHKSKEG